MEDTFSRTRNGWRSVNSTFLHHVLFIIIIVRELTMAFFLWLGIFTMKRKMRAAGGEFQQAKKYTSTGFTLGVLLWFMGFITMGGEWFLLWQSKTWNVQPTAFLLTACLLLFLFTITSSTVNIRSTCRAW